MPATNLSELSSVAQKQRRPGNCGLRRGRVSLPNHVYLVTTVTRKREPFFADFAAACAASRCFDDMHVLGDASMLAWVLMPDHAHWLIRLDETDPLDAVVNRLKSASARSTNRALQRSGPLWTQAFHDHAVRVEEDLRRSARYVVANPVRAKLVERVGDYPFWNAVWV